MYCWMTSGTVNTRRLPVFCSVISRRYLSPSRTISQGRSFNISLIRKPKFPSSTRAVAMRSLGRQPLNPSRMVWIISLYCSVVSAFVFLFMVASIVKSSFFQAGKFVYDGRRRKSPVIARFRCSYFWTYTNFGNWVGIAPRPSLLPGKHHRRAAI